MAYDELVAARLRAALAGDPAITEKQMFGGVAFLRNGHMLVGVNGERLIVRVGPEQYQETLRNPQVRPFDMTGREMKGWVFVSPGGYTDEPSLRAWIEKAVRFVTSLPPK